MGGLPFATFKQWGQAWDKALENTNAARHAKLCGVTSADLKPGYERVHTVVDYYDGPRKGIADYGGKPHLFECIFDESKDDYSQMFHLKLLDPETFRIAMEDWAIWKRWEMHFTPVRQTSVRILRCRMKA